MIRLLLKGNILHISPWHAILSGSCTGKRCRPTTPDEKAAAKARGTKSIPKYKWDKIPLFDKTQIGDAVTHIGLFPRVAKELRDRGIEYMVIDERDSLPDFDVTKVEDLRVLQPEVIALISASRFGIINCATAFGKSYAIKQLCRAWVSSNILITTGSKALVGDLYKKICESCPERKIARCSGSHRFKEQAEIIVCTAGSLHKIPVDWADIVLYDECHEAAAPSIAPQMLRFSNTLRFGFSASPGGRSDKADRILEAIFGPTIAEVTYQEAEQAGIVTPIRVGMVSVASNEEVNASNDTWNKINGYWRHRTRNSLIAKCAEQFSAFKVLLYVEKTEHALRLHKLLPEYTVVHAGCGEEQWANFLKWGLVEQGDTHLKKPPADKIRDDFTSGAIQKVICTTVWRQGVDFPDLSVLIRADGQSGEIPCTQIVGRLSRITEGKEYAMLVDFYDEFGQWFQERAKKRVAKYKGKGWTIRSWDP